MLLKGKINKSNEKKKSNKRHKYKLMRTRVTSRPSLDRSLEGEEATKAQELLLIILLLVFQLGAFRWALNTHKGTLWPLVRVNCRKSSIFQISSDFSFPKKIQICFSESHVVLFVTVQNEYWFLATYLDK